jgi:hypothetical protein
MSNCRICRGVLTDNNWTVSKRRENSLICKECDALESKKYYNANKERINARRRGYVVIGV